MKSSYWPAALAAAAVLSLGGYLAADEEGRRYVKTDLVVNKSANGVPTLKDENGVVHTAKVADSNLVNPRGLAESATSFFWIADNGAGVSTLYDTTGAPQTLVVSLPAPSRN